MSVSNFRLYIKAILKKKTFTTKLAQKIGFKGLSYYTSNVGDSEMLRDDFYFVVSFDKWRFVTQDGIIPSYDLNNPWNSYKCENISLNLKKLSLQSGERGVSYVSQLPYRCFNSW